MEEITAASELLATIADDDDLANTAEDIIATIAPLKIPIRSITAAVTAKIIRNGKRRDAGPSM